MVSLDQVILQGNQHRLLKISRDNPALQDNIEPQLATLLNLLCLDSIGFPSNKLQQKDAEFFQSDIA